MDDSFLFYCQSCCFQFAVRELCVRHGCIGRCVAVRTVQTEIRTINVQRYVCYGGYKKISNRLSVLYSGKYYFLSNKFWSQFFSFYAKKIDTINFLDLAKGQFFIDVNFLYDFLEWRGDWEILKMCWQRRVSWKELIWVVVKGLQLLPMVTLIWSQSFVS